MKLSGRYKLSVKKNVVWEALNDPNILKQCIPGCESFDKENENTFKAIATNQIGPMNASFSGTVNLSNIKPNESYTLSGEGNSSVGFVNGSADVRLFEENNNTTLSYEVNVNVGGKIAQIGSRLIDMTAKKMADIFFKNFSESIVTDDKTTKDIKTEVEIKKEQKFGIVFKRKYIYLLLALIVLFIIVVFN